MNHSLYYPILVAIKKRNPNISCSQYNGCSLKTDGLAGILSSSSVKRKNKVAKKFNCIIPNCKEGSNVVKIQVYDNWIKPLINTDFWDKITTTDLSLDNNLFIFSSRFIESTMNQFIEEIENSDLRLPDVVKECGNMLFAYFSDSTLKIVVIDNGYSLDVVEVNSSSQIVSYLGCNLDDYDAEDDSEDEELRKKSRNYEATIISVIKLIPFLRNEGVRIEKGGVILKNPMDSFYNDTPYDVIMY